MVVMVGARYRAAAGAKADVFLLAARCVELKPRWNQCVFNAYRNMEILQLWPWLLVITGYFYDVIIPLMGLQLT